MSEKNLIAFLCHPYHRGGVTRWMADAAVFAANSGYEVYFVTVEPTRPFVSSGGREAMVSLLAPYKDKVHIGSSKVGFEFEFGTEQYRAAMYSDLVLKHVPVRTPVIVSDDIAVWAAAANVADRYPMVGVLHGDQHYYSDKAAKYQQQLSVAVCVSERVRQRLIAKCPTFDQGRIFTIPCGIVLPAFAPKRAGDGTTRMIFAGRLTDYEKRAYDLIAICAKLHQQGFPFQLDIVGNSEASKTEFQGKLREHGVDQFVHFHGWQAAEEVHRLMSSSDILLLTSNSEGMPLVMMEALAAGCGFTGTRVSGIEDYEHHPLAAECVSVYAVGDTDEAIHKIRKIASIPTATRQAAARALAEKEFTMQVCLDKYFAALSTVSLENIKAQRIALSMTGKIQSTLIAMARYLKVSIAKRK